MALNRYPSSCDQRFPRIDGQWKRSNPVPLPQPEPRIVRVHLVVPLVCGVAVGQLERSGVAKGIKTLKPIYLGNGSLNVHVVLKALDAQLGEQESPSRRGAQSKAV